ncbi:hypothetical protein BVC80_8149g5 [Macleaya cordata]|uniref:Uncharacterized protein n=1 Tax=Macleaya cordata TaxID=56857 RepID=A0A200QXU9_MACCD|nr:hypothetical protein BVC80_8149g5 [Macleaya cordata]
MGDTQLKKVAPSLYNIASAKLGTIADHIQISLTGTYSWNITFKRRRLDDRETMQLSALFSAISESPPTLNSSDDYRRWTLSAKGQFLVKSLYEELIKTESNEFPSKLIWNTIDPPKINFFF